MNTVFLSGSQGITHLNGQVRSRLDALLQKSAHILIGDANGVDRSIQMYLAGKGYRQVTVYCSGSQFRNNVGSWKTKRISVPSHLRGRDFYTRKDKAMAEDADRGFVIWDGSSAGSIENVLELLKRGKKATVYLEPKDQFFLVNSVEPLKLLLSNVSGGAMAAIERKVGLSDALKALQSS